MIRFVVLSVLLCVVSAQLPRPCESPKQWEGKVITVDRKENFFRAGRISYDEYAPRFRIIEEEAVGKQVDYYDVLYLHNVGKEYRLNLKTRQCNVTALTRPFRPFGVPPMANFTGEATIGAAGIAGENVVIENFNGHTYLINAWYIVHDKQMTLYENHCCPAHCCHGNISKKCIHHEIWKKNINVTFLFPS